MTSSEPVIQTVTVTDPSVLKNYYELFIGSESGPVPAFPPYESAWDGFHPKWGNYRVWVDGTGSIRIKNGAPTSDTDGVLIGSGGGTGILVLDSAEPVPAGTPAGTVILRLA